MNGIKEIILKTTTCGEKKLIIGTRIVWVFVASKTTTNPTEMKTKIATIFKM